MYKIRPEDMLPALHLLPIAASHKLKRRVQKNRGESVPCSENPHRLVVAFYANPIFPKTLTDRGNFLPLTSLTRDMRYVVTTTNPYDFAILPATRWSDMKQAVQRFSPKVILWSGHTIGENKMRSLVFETDNGAVDANFVDGATLGNALSGFKSVELVCLMGCYSAELVDHISDDVRDRCAFVAWRTVVEDAAAVAFVGGVVDELQKVAVQKSGVVDARVVYQAGRAAFEAAGKRFGDPLQDSGESHGQPVLLTAGVSEDYVQ